MFIILECLELVEFDYVFIILEFVYGIKVILFGIYFCYIKMNDVCVLV